nr:acyl-CoA dehydrogenase family protein [Minwuia thermotolerans]
MSVAVSRRDVLRKMAEAGLMGGTINPAYGGAGTDFVSYVLAIEEIAAADGGLSNIIVDVRTDEVKVIGPMTKEEKQKRDRLIRIKDTCREEIGILEEKLSHETLSPDLRAKFEGYLATHRRILRQAREVFPDEQEAAYRARYKEAAGD